MIIGGYDVDNKLFERYIRAITAVKANPFEAKYDDERWNVHNRILESVGLRRGGSAYCDSPSRMQTPTRLNARRSLEALPHVSSFPDNVAARKFNDALRAEVEEFLENY